MDSLVQTCHIRDPKRGLVCYAIKQEQIPQDAGLKIIVPADFKKLVLPSGNEYLYSENPEAEFLELHNKAHPPPVGTHPRAMVEKCVVMGEDCYIDAGARVGGGGFRRIRNKDGNYERLTHIGGVRLGKGVTIGANACVDRGTFGDTILEDYVQVDNLVHIAHNCHIGKNTQIVAQSCIGGSVVIGENVWVSMGVMIRNGLKIGDNAVLNMNAVVTKDVPPNTTVAGFYAVEQQKWNDHFKRDVLKR